MKVRGRAWKFGDKITTDHIAPGRFFHLRSNLPEFAKHCFEDVRPEFTSSVKSGDFVVGGENFGLGSSREHAPTLLKLCGIGAVFAKSFARIFFRNCINVGLPALIIDTDKINDGNELEVDLASGTIKNLTTGNEMTAPPLPSVMRTIIDDGGLVEHIKKHGKLELD
jgi:3-isopropylmalate/(R)-2-methylmalate dehydratase small subunit